MGGISDYIKWRGDLTFKQSPFNEVDNLILSEISYVDFGGIIPECGTGKAVSLQQASRRFFRRHKDEDLKNVKTFIWEAPFLMRQAAESRRFAEVILSDYIDIVDNEEEKQFSAFLINLGDGTFYLVFRGTDDTIIGWKEDFNMSFIMPVPSQIQVAEYANRVLKGKRGKWRFGGHSKGGNLAIYAAAYMQEKYKKKLIEVYSNDGPGFDKSMTESSQYQEILPKVKAIVPEHSVVGMLLYHSEDYLVVKSSQTGIMQHDAMSWEVEGKGFVICRSLSRNSRMLNEAMTTWIESLEYSEREKFVETLFGIITASGAVTLSDINADLFKSANASIKMFHSLDADTRSMILKILKSLTVEIKKAKKGRTV
jgi:hypothetical protein